MAMQKLYHCDRPPGGVSTTTKASGHRARSALGARVMVASDFIVGLKQQLDAMKASLQLTATQTTADTTEHVRVLQAEFRATGYGNRAISCCAHAVFEIPNTHTWALHTGRSAHSMASHGSCMM